LALRPTVAHNAPATLQCLSPSPRQSQQRSMASGRSRTHQHMVAATATERRRRRYLSHAMGLARSILTHRSSMCVHPSPSRIDARLLTPGLTPCHFTSDLLQLNMGARVAVARCRCPYPGHIPRLVLGFCSTYQEMDPSLLTPAARLTGNKTVFF
jgi:hypothetical protein